jgi:hypothetical protein
MAILKNGSMCDNKDNDFVYFISPPPDLPVKGGGRLISFPWREGLKGGGDKMAFTFLFCIWYPYN